MILIKDLIKRFKNLTAVDIKSLQIDDGELLGIVGNNGAGKTTLLRLITDLLIPNNGRVLINNINVSSDQRWKSQTGAYFDESFLVNYLSPLEYVTLIAKLRGIGTDDMNKRIDEWTDFFDIRQCKNLIRSLSTGNKQKVGIIGALLAHKNILILDEPFAHLDPTSQIQLSTIIKNLPGPEKCIILSDHNTEHIIRICDRIIILDAGRIKNDLF